MVNVQFKRGIETPLSSESIQKVAQDALRLASAPIEAELTIVLTGDRELQRLNRQYLGVDAPTDVLSFPADFTDPDSQQTYLGDILISVERLRQQAEAGKHPPQDELRLLIVHGILHLLGYDHAEQADQERMWALQEQILALLSKGEFK